MFSVLGKWTTRSRLKGCKQIETLFPVCKLIASRWSPRAFAPDRGVEEWKLGAMCEAARLAPSAWNEQPWRFILGIRGRDDTYDRIFDSLREANQSWARTAPVLIAAVSKMYLEHKGPSSVATYRHGYYDVGQAVLAMTVQALSDGIYVHQMAGFCPTKIRESFEVPELYDPITVIAAGYPGDIDLLPENLRERESSQRTRKDLAEIVFCGTWGDGTWFEHVRREHNELDSDAYGSLFTWM